MVGWLSDCTYSKSTCGADNIDQKVCGILYFVLRIHPPLLVKSSHIFNFHSAQPLILSLGKCLQAVYKIKFAKKWWIGKLSKVRIGFLCVASLSCTLDLSLLHPVFRFQFTVFCEEIFLCLNPSSSLQGNLELLSPTIFTAVHLPFLCCIFFLFSVSVSVFSIPPPPACELLSPTIFTAVHLPASKIHGSAVKNQIAMP